MSALTATGTRFLGPDPALSASDEGLVRRLT